MSGTFEDHELYIAPGKLHGRDEPFVIYGRGPRER